jgi:alpha-L-fucosidase 2
LPAAWPTGSLRGVRVRNAGELDLSWRDGRLETVTLRCATSGHRTVQCGEVSRRIFVRAGERVVLAGPSLQGSARAS